MTKKALISYSHKDEAYRSSLVSALSGLVRKGDLEIWSDHQILPGQVLDDQIMANLKEADVVILLVSQDFISSDYCYKKELQIALERHENGRSIVVPVVVRATDLHGMPFAHLLMLPLDARPISSWGNIDEAWMSVAQGIRRLLEKLPDQRPVSQVKTKAINDHLRGVFEELRIRFEGHGTLGPMGFGFTFDDLDAAIGGLWPSDWLLLAGRPDHGHVELAHALILDASVRAKRRVFVSSQRLTSQQFTNRLMCNLGRIPRMSVATGQLEDEDWSRVTSGIRMLKDADLTIDDDPIRSHSALKRKLSYLREESFDLIVWDGLEYVNDGSEERNIALTLSDFAREKSTVMAATLSIGSEVEVRASQRPLLSDLKGWGALEDLATKILFCSRELTWTNLHSDLSRGCDLYLVKNSDGSPGVFSAIYFDEYRLVNGTSLVREQ